MTITPTDEDIAEAMRSVDAAPFWKPDYVRQFAENRSATTTERWLAATILAHAQTISKLRTFEENSRKPCKNCGFVPDKTG